MLKNTLLIFFAFSLFANLSANEKERVAVSTFKASGEGMSEVAEELGAQIEEELFNSSLFTIINRTKTDDIIKEIKLQQTGLTDQSTALSAGKQLNVAKIIYGKVSRINNQLTLRLWAVNVESGENVYIGSATNDLSEEDATAKFTKEANKKIKEMIYKLTGTKVVVGNSDEPDPKDLTITLIQATDVTAMDETSDSDVFVQIKVGDLFVGTTNKIQDAKNPYWNESFRYKNYKNEFIYFYFYDKDLTKNEFIGSYYMTQPIDGIYDILVSINGVDYSRGKFKVKYELK
jgi:hypothetical protein